MKIRYNINSNEQTQGLIWYDTSVYQYVCGLIGDKINDKLLSNIFCTYYKNTNSCSRRRSRSSGHFGCSWSLVGATSTAAVTATSSTKENANGNQYAYETRYSTHQEGTDLGQLGCKNIFFFQNPSLHVGKCDNILCLLYHFSTQYVLKFDDFELDQKSGQSLSFCPELQCYQIRLESFSPFHWAQTTNKY